MKQLTCEMCGSTDLMKQDGVFVCQTCGCKYSVEEAKKMMMEVSGTVQVSNMAQVDNLLKLAHSSYESNNFAKAEDFCNQILAMDDSNFEAWKLKGQAINGQISVKNPRIDEVFNCVMMSYKVSSDAEKEERKFDLLSWLVDCFKSEINFWLDQLEAQRPTAGVVKKAQNSYIDCWNKTQQACNDMDVEEDIKEILLNGLDNYFIQKAEITLVSTWKSTVAYNYYRDTYSNGHWTDDEYRPSDEIFTTFLEEGDNLIGLMRFCEDQFNKSTSPSDKEALYSNIAFIHGELCKGQSYTRMVSTTTNGYGAVISERKYWDNSKSLTSGARASRQSDIRECESLERKYHAEAEQKKKAEAKERFEKYWNEHSEEKAHLEKEISELKFRISEYEKEISQIPGTAELKNLEDRIGALTSEKAALGLFKMKEKKAVQEKIDSANQELNNIREKVNTRKEAINEKIIPLRARVDEINTELTKER